MRSTAAGLLALVTAHVLGLQQPQWAMMTVFIVAQPVAGMVLAKGFFRLAGTLVGTIAAVAITDLAGWSPWAFVTVLALWVALCTFIASMLRNPESYGAALAGYTAAIIGLPAFGHPHLSVELATARCAEIMLGIVCAGAASRLVLPQLARDVMVQRLATCIGSVAAYGLAASRGATAAALDAQHRELIAETQALAAMRAYARLEAPGLVSHGRHSRHTIGHLLSVLSALRALHAHGGLAAPVLRPASEAFESCLAAIVAPKGLDELRPHLRRLEALAGEAQRTAGEITPAVPGLDASDPAGSAARLQLLGDIAASLREALQGLGALRMRAPGPLRPQAIPALAVFRDRQAALANAIRAGIATFCVCAFWMLTRWADATGTAIIVAVVSSLFASLPNPLQSAWGFFKGTLLAAPFAFVVGQLLLPLLPGLPALALIVVPVLVPAALAMANPRHTGVATAFAINFVVFLNPREAMAYAPLVFVNATVSILTGILLSMAVFALVLPQRPDETVGRLVRAMQSDLVRLCLHPRIPRPSAFESIAYDRVNQLMALAQSRSAPAIARLDAAIASVTLGLEILRLRRLRAAPDAPAAIAAAADGSLALLSRALALGSDRGQPPPDIVTALRSTASELARSSRGLQAAACLRLIAVVIEDHPTLLRSPA